MNDAVDLLLGVFVGVIGWMALAYGVAWRRTRQASLGNASLIYALVTIVVVGIMVLPDSRTYLMPVVLVTLVINLLVARQRFLLQRLYRRPWDIVLFRHPRQGE